MVTEEHRGQFAMGDSGNTGHSGHRRNIGYRKQKTQRFTLWTGTLSVHYVSCKPFNLLVITDFCVCSFCNLKSP